MVEATLALVATEGDMSTYDMFNAAVVATPMTSQQLLDTYTRELMLISGKDGVGKSCAIVSMASFVAMTNPNAKFNVIDTEHKFGSALKSFGRDEAPRNICYWPVEDMNEATLALRNVLKGAKPGDWLAVESMARMWERSQNLAYEAVAGVSKIEYLDAKLNTPFTGNDGGKTVRKNSPIPRPDDFWAVCKGAHDAGFLDLITNSGELNCILTTTLKPPPKEREGRSFDNKDRAILRAELGIDLNLDGAPRLPYYMETMCLLELSQGKVSCRVLRDNNNTHSDTRPTFLVPDRKSWAMMFMTECR